MEINAARDALPGTTFTEKLASLGIERGRMLDIRDLDDIGREYGVDIYLFFEKDLATAKTLAEVQSEYKEVPEFERPYVRIDSFLRFTRENDPSFSQTLNEFPLMIEIVTVGETPGAGTGSAVPFVTGLMPFLDELDVDSDPVEQARVP
jgi:hypothetical protein